MTHGQQQEGREEGRRLAEDTTALWCGEWRYLVLRFYGRPRETNVGQTNVEAVQASRKGGQGIMRTRIGREHVRVEHVHNGTEATSDNLFGE